MPAEHEQPDQRRARSASTGAVGEDERAARPDCPTSGLIWNWCIGSILVSAATRHLPSSPSFGALLRNLPNFPHGDAEPEEQHHHPDPAASPRSDRSHSRSARCRADSRPAPTGRASPWAWPSAAPRPRVPPVRAASSACACAQPLVERGQPRILGRLRVLPGLVFRHAVLPCAAARSKSAVRRGRGTCRRTNPPRRGSFRKRPDQVNTLRQCSKASTAPVAAAWRDR